MPSPKQTYGPPSAPPSLAGKEEQLEYGFIGKLQGLKYEYRPDIRDRASLERNFREKLEALNRVHLSDGEFARLLDEIVTPDVYTAARTLRERNAFTRDDGTPLNYTLVNIKDWCKNSFEVVNQLRVNTDYTLRATDDTPFFHHVAMLAEIKKAADGGKLYTFHFNMLRSILEKTATFFGNDDFSACIHGLDDEELFARALNLLSHGKYDIYQPAEMVDDNKRLFRQILDAFLGRYQFTLPDVFGKPAAKATPATAA